MSSIRASKDSRLHELNLFLPSDADISDPDFNSLSFQISENMMNSEGSRPFVSVSPAPGTETEGSRTCWWKHKAVYCPAGGAVISGIRSGFKIKVIYTVVMESAVYPKGSLMSH